MVVAYVVAVRYQGDLVPLLLMAYGWVVQFAPGVVASLYLRWPSGNAVLAGLLTGFALTLLFVQMPEWRPFPVHAGLYGLVVNVATIIVVTALTGGAASARDSEFLAVARGDARSAD